TAPASARESPKAAAQRTEAKSARHKGMARLCNGVPGPATNARKTRARAEVERGNRPSHPGGCGGSLRRFPDARRARRPRDSFRSSLDRRRAIEKTWRSIGRVSLPVKVFCWLG